jgi:hypothetical protein
VFSRQEKGGILEKLHTELRGDYMNLREIGREFKLLRIVTGMGFGL